MTVKLLLGAFGLAFILFGIYFIYDSVKSKKAGKWEQEKVWKPIVTGYVSNFCDTLGIGSFAVAMFLFKALRHEMPDKHIPGTLNVAFAFPTLLEAILFTQAVEVESITLVTLILAAIVGSYIGAGIISKMNEKAIQIIIGFALLAAAGLFTAGLLNIMPLGGDEIGLHGIKLVVTAAIFVVLGGLMTAGIGLYAPAMVVIALMGMSPATAFPIMMGSCALLMPVSGVKFVKEEAFAKKNSVFLAAAGLLGSISAYTFFQGLSLEKLKILVTIVIFLTALMMLRAGIKSKKSE